MYLFGSTYGVLRFSVVSIAKLFSFSEMVENLMSEPVGSQRSVHEAYGAFYQPNKILIVHRGFVGSLDANQPLGIAI
jgi:hypothetical protein